MNMMQKLTKILLLATALAWLSGCALIPGLKHKPGEYDFLLSHDVEKQQRLNATLGDEKPQGVTEAHLTALMAEREGDTDKALYYYVKALEIDKKDKTSLLAIARIHRGRGNTDLAIMASRLALQFDPKNAEALESLGLALIQNNQNEQAWDTLILAFAQDAHRPAVYNGLAVIADLGGFFEAARWLYREALTMDPNSPVLRNNLAYSYYLSNEWDKAAKLYTDLLARNPNDGQAALNYGLLLARRGEMYDALQSFERVLAKPQAYNELGFILMMEQKYVLAEQLFQKAVAASPSYFEQAYANLERLKQMKDKVPTLDEHETGIMKLGSNEGQSMRSIP